MAIGKVWKALALVVLVCSIKDLVVNITALVKERQ